MHAEDLLVNNSSNWQAVEHVTEYLPESYRVSPFTFIVKPVNTVDLGAFVIASQQEEILRVLDFVAEQQTYCFN